MPEAGDKRQFFRINDEVDLYYRKIDCQEAIEVSHIVENVVTSTTYPQITAALEKDMSGLLKRIETTQPDVAEYLKLLDYKANLLAECLLRQSDLLRQKNTCQVNLSASGLAFGSEHALHEGDFLQLRILLLASRTLVTTCCRVIQCRSNPAYDQRYPYVLSVDFLNMKEADRELIIRHVLKRQMAQISGQET